MRQNRLKFNEVAGQWLEISGMRVKESSYIKYRNILENHLLPELGECAAEELTTERISAYARKILAEGRIDRQGGLSEKSVRDIMIVLKGICRQAEQMDLEVPCRFDMIKFRRNTCEVRVLDKRERITLEEFLFQDNDLKKTGILISLFMGLRLGEVCALKKRNILREEEILCVRSTMQRIQDPSQPSGHKTKVIVTPPKSRSAVRDIPIPEFMLKRFGPIDGMSDDAYILTGSEEKFIEPRTLENVFKRCLKKCSMPEVNYHVLRHTFATRCIEAGIDAKSLSEILGHANVNITLNQYVHSSMEQKRENMKKLMAGA